MEWRGTIARIEDNRRRLTIRVDDLTFSVQYDFETAPDVREGAVVTVAGIVKGRSEGVVALEGRGKPVVLTAED